MKRLLTRVLTAACLWAAASVSAQAAPLFEPDGTWTTMETPHFRIYYTAPLAHKAKQIAQIAEDAHAKLAPYMQVTPAGPTEVIIADGYDVLNSMAHASPHRAVWLWQTPPNPDEGMPIGRYDEWMRLLFIHEYTHILQFEHTPWLVNQVNTALGGLLINSFPQLPIEITLNLPDLLSNAPSFFTEGLAVYTESTFTPGGRGVEGDYEMLRRMAFLEGQVPELDQVWGRYLLDWPMGGYEYTWGTPFIEHMVAKHGHDAPVRVLQTYGTMPWLGFDVAVRRALGVSAEEIWDGMRQELASRYQAQKMAHDARRQLAATDGAPWNMPEAKAVTTSGRYHRHPQWLPDGTLLYAEALKNQSPRLYADKLDGSDRQAIMGKSTRSSIAVGPRGEKLYFESDTEDTVKKLSSYRDLFVFDRETKKAKRLTRGERTFAPAVSPDGARLVAVTSGEGRSGLAIFDNEGQRLKKWTFDNNDYQFGNPVWSPDGSMLAVAVWHAGSRDLYLIDPESGEQTPLWQDAAVDFYPSWSPDGQYLVFTSDRTEGVFNLHAYHLASRSLYQLTDVLGGAFDPSVSPDGKTLAFANYGGQGYDIQTIPFLPTEGLKVAEPPLPMGVELAKAELMPEVEALGIRPYNPLPTMTPSLWLPFLSQDEWGPNLTVYSFWQDLLREHYVMAGGGMGLNSQRLNYVFRYTNNQIVPQWTVNVSENPLPGRVILGDNAFGTLWQWNKAAGVSVSYPGLRYPMFDPPPISGDNWTLGYRTEFVSDYALQPDEPGDPSQAVVPVEQHASQPFAQDEGQTNSLYLQWQRANALRYPYDYGPTAGQITTVGVEAGLQSLYSQNVNVGPYFGRFWADHRFYQALPWAEKHSLAMRTTAGAVQGRNGEFYLSQWRSPFGYTPLSTINRWDLTTASSYDTRQVMLRGYPFLLGNRNLTAGIEYRFPIAEVARGWGGSPLFLNRVYGVGFLDSGFFWGLDPHELTLPGLADFKSGAGFELRAQTTMFQAVPVDLRVGLAQALTRETDGSLLPPQFNFGLGTTF